ncbi:hypothetical protein BHM03_00006652 [Ensete ventricosum]|nr:hypothetical protein BHM03_00006652 [Ensete ventricosum]
MSECNQRWRRPYDVNSESHGGDLIIQRYDGVTRELDYSNSYIRLRELDKLEDKAERDFRGVIDPLLLCRESVGRKKGRGAREYRGKLQVLRQDGRAEAKELHKTDVDGLLIKIAESERLQVDARVLDQGTK